MYARPKRIVHALTAKVLTLHVLEPGLTQFLGQRVTGRRPSRYPHFAPQHPPLFDLDDEPYQQTERDAQPKVGG